MKHSFQLAWVLGALIAYLLMSRPVYAEDLKLTADLAFSISGPVRHNSYYPGDAVHYSVRLDNLGKDSEGRFSVRYQYELRNKNGDLNSILAVGSPKFTPGLGGDCMWIRGTYTLPMDFASGEYKVLVSVKDLIRDRSESVELPFSVLDPVGPYLLGVRYCGDHEGNVPASGRFVEGEDVFIHLVIGGLEQIEGDKCTCTLRFIEKDQPVGAPIEFDVDGRASKNRVFHETAFGFSPNRVFKGKVRIECKSKNNKCIVELPYEVLPRVARR